MKASTWFHALPRITSRETEPSTHWIERWLGPSGRYGQNTNILPLQGIEAWFLVCLARSTVCRPTEIFRFQREVKTDNNDSAMQDEIRIEEKNK